MPREEIRELAGVRCLFYENLLGTGVLHGFTTRHGGVGLPPYHSLNLGAHVGDSRQTVVQNRRLLAAALGYRPEDVVAGQQVHGVRIQRVTAADRGRGSLDMSDVLPQTDGLVSTDENVVLMAHSADCTILFFYEPHVRCIGLAHAGWRGAVAGMAAAMVEEMVALGCARREIRVALSPAVGACCYRVGEEVAGEVPPSLRQDVLIARGDGLYLDLAGLHTGMLHKSGISSRQITASAFCTNCRDDLFFSYRASGGKTGRMAGVLSLIPVGQAML